MTEQDVLKALEGVKDPDLNRDLVELGMIKNVVVDLPRIALTVDLTTPACPLKDVIKGDIEKALKSKIPAATNIEIEFTASVRRSMKTGSELLPGVRNVLLVGSGKGGVGKSTVAANIAIALRQTGASVGMLDADIYGPSVPTAFGLENVRPEATSEQRIVPVEKYGLKLMSMGLLLDAGQPVVWRGPMLDGALTQFLGQVEWGDLDYLVIDLPPGTGDVQLSLSRLLPQAFALIITTPQDIALVDVARAVNMFKQVKLHVLGLVENMSGFICGHCGERTDIFLSGGGRRASERFHINFFGEIPLSADVAQLTDAGTPVLLAQPDSTYAAILREICGGVARSIAVESERRGVTEADVVGAGAGGGQAMPQGGHRPIGVAPGQRPPAEKAASKPASGFQRL